MAENLMQSLTLDDREDSDSEESERDTTEENDTCESSSEILPPSKVTEKDYIYMPSSFENFEGREEWKSSGKWMLFTHGSFEKLDSWWTHLQPLLADETLLCIKSSTAKDTDPLNGIIMCYTSDCEDREAVKKAADDIRNAISIKYMIYYKTNEASDAGLYKMHGDSGFTKYMHSVACSLYERDVHKRWVKVPLETNDSQIDDFQ